jgi:competence protein ComEC
MQVKTTRYPACFLASAYAAGIGSEKLFDIIPLVWMGLFFLVILLTIWIRNGGWRICFIFLLFFCAGGLKYQTWVEQNLNHPISTYFPLPELMVWAQVTAPPRKPVHYATVRVDELQWQEFRIKINRRFTIRLDKLTHQLLPGDVLFLRNVMLSESKKPRNPGQFNMANYLQQQGIIGEIIVDQNSLIVADISKNKFSLYRISFQIREYLDRQIHTLLSEAQANFLSAILLGKKGGIGKDVKADFQKSGVAHLLAISGLHVGFIVLFVYILLSFLPISFRLHHILIFIILLFYAMLTGANPPVVRATLMVGIFLLGKNLERRAVIYNTVFATAFLILFFQPQQLFWVGFQFSFMAVLPILFFYKRFKAFEDRMPRQIATLKYAEKFRKWIFTPFFVSLAAQLGTIPLMGFYFKSIPVISLLLNIVVIPLLGFIVPIGLLVLFFSLFSSAMANVICGVLAELIDLLVKIVHFAANLPYAYFTIPSVGLGEIMLYILLLWVIFTWRHANLKIVQKPACIFLIFLFLWIIGPKPHRAQMLLLDVGQGESTLVITPHGKQLLFDAGPVSDKWDSGRDVIFPVLQHLKRLHLDKVILSHAHTDHLAGIFWLLNSVTIDSLYLPKLETSYFWQDSLLKTLQSNEIPFRLLLVGDILEIDKSSTIYILAPFPQFCKPLRPSGENINNSSIVALFKTGPSAALFTGDAEVGVEKELLRWGNLLDSDILKLGHHGSITSSSRDFLRKVSPDIGLIPVGRKNKYDHPSETVIRRLESLNVRFFRTDLDGAVWLEMDNNKWRVKEWQ